MLRNIVKRFNIISVNNTIKPTYYFGGSAGHHHGQEHHDHHDHHDHHQIDLQKMKLRDQQSARRIFRIIAQFDKVKNPQSLTLNSQWHQMGLNQLDTVQLLVGIQDQFQIQFPDQVVQKFKDVNDAVQYVSRSFWSE